MRASFLASVAWYRALDERPGPRFWFEWVDRDGVVDEGARMLLEAVERDGELTAVKQIDISSVGEVRRHWWQRLESDEGGLTEAAVEPTEPGLEPISRDAFYAEWQRA